MSAGIGRNSLLTADEYREVVAWLELRSSSQLLDIGCGSGGPAPFAAAATGTRVGGIDASGLAIDAAHPMARPRRRDLLVHFRWAGATRPLPFADASFAAVICIDAIDHLPGRSGVLVEPRRVRCASAGVRS